MYIDVAVLPTLVFIENSDKDSGLYKDMHRTVLYSVMSTVSQVTQVLLYKELKTSSHPQNTFV